MLFILFQMQKRLDMFLLFQYKAIEKNLHVFDSMELIHF